MCIIMYDKCMLSVKHAMYYCLRIVHLAGIMLLKMLKIKRKLCVYEILCYVYTHKKLLKYNIIHMFLIIIIQQA